MAHPVPPTPTHPVSPSDAFYPPSSPIQPDTRVPKWRTREGAHLVSECEHMRTQFLMLKWGVKTQNRPFWRQRKPRCARMKARCARAARAQRCAIAIQGEMGRFRLDSMVHCWPFRSFWGLYLRPRAPYRRSTCRLDPGWLMRPSIRGIELGFFSI